MPATPEPLATLKATERWLDRPLRIDARRNTATFDLKGHRTVLARLRAAIARVENHRTNGGH
jgi:hypothetical protein